MTQLFSLHRRRWCAVSVAWTVMITLSGCGGAVSQSPQAASAQQAAPPAQPDVAAPFRHTVKPGESLPQLVRQYLSKTSFMTGEELEAALRAANQKPAGSRLKPGEQIIIPGYEAGPIVERSQPLAKEAEVRAIYLTGGMAGSDRGIRLIRRWHELGGNSVVFDIKDSDGLVNIAFDHPLAPERRRHAIANLPKLVRYLHSLQMHAIARIALFRDEHIARDHPDLAVQSRRARAAAAGKEQPQPWRENGKLVWTDPSNRAVQDYNLALAKFVAGSGADEVQFDYVRFPAEGDQADALFAFQSQPVAAGTRPLTRADVIAGFLDRAYSELHKAGTLLSLDVFGVMAWRRPVDLSHTGQDIQRMAQFCDVLSPMIYPSHFFKMDGYAYPGDAPEHFIGVSMERFHNLTQASGVVLRPWLQAFAWRTKTYSPQYIALQVKTSHAKGGVGFLFWNARNDYGRPFLAMPEMRAKPELYFQTASKASIAAANAPERPLPAGVAAKNPAPAGEGAQPAPAAAAPPCSEEAPQSSEAPSPDEVAKKSDCPQLNASPLPQ